MSSQVFFSISSNQPIDFKTDQSDEQQDSLVSSDGNWIRRIEEFPESSKPILPSVINKIISMIKDTFFLIGNLFSRITHRSNYAKPSDAIPVNDDTQALCVLLTGLKGHPSVMDSHRDSIEDELGSKVTFYQPYIPYNGNCSLDEAVANIYDQVLAWSQRNQDKPIVFSGISNGARMSALMASRLKIQDQIPNPIKVNCVAGPFFGTKMISQPEWSEENQQRWKNLLRLPIVGISSEEILNELSFASEPSKTLITFMRDAARNHGVFFNFYSTWADNQVVPFTSALPKDIDHAKYVVLKNEGHASIVKATRFHIAKEAREFVEGTGV